MSKQTSVIIAVLPIRLGQFLKAANLVQDGFEARIRIQHGEVLLNGAVETQRGKQLQEGDIITMAGREYRICSQPGISDHDCLP
jgi:ribosome-associated protein